MQFSWKLSSVMVRWRSLPFTSQIQHMNAMSSDYQLHELIHIYAVMSMG